MENTAKSTQQAVRTVRRDAQRGEALGEETLTAVKGTSLDTGAELDALVKLPETERAEIVAKAAAGEKVSARKSQAPAPTAPTVQKSTKKPRGVSAEERAQASEELAAGVDTIKPVPAARSVGAGRPDRRHSRPEGKRRCRWLGCGWVAPDRGKGLWITLA